MSMTCEGLRAPIMSWMAGSTRAPTTPSTCTTGCRQKRPLGAEAWEGDVPWELRGGVEIRLPHGRPRV